MKVNLHIGTIYVDFYVDKKKSGRHGTMCVISDANDIDEKTDKFSIISMGTSKCSPKDKYNKATGKAKSLERALKTDLFSRADRITIWRRFFQELKTPDKCKLANITKWDTKG